MWTPLGIPPGGRPLGVNAILTGAVGMILVFVYLLEATSFTNRQSPTLLLLAHALGSTALLLQGVCLLARESLSGEKQEKPQGD